MLPEQIKNHREVVTLKDGAYVLLRAMAAEDKKALHTFFNAAGEEDHRYFRHNVRDKKVVDGWCDNLDYTQVLPIVALVKERVVGLASLHFFAGPRRHTGEVRIFLSKEFRKRGLGMKMIRALTELARKQGLYVLTAEIIADKTKVIKAFEQIGFKADCTLDDFFMFPDGDCCDVVLMTLPLRPKSDEF